MDFEYLMFLVPFALVLSLPLIWVWNRFVRKVRRDKVVGWVMLVATILFGIGVMTLPDSNLTEKGLTIIAIGFIVLDLLFYAAYWVTVRVRKLTDRYNTATIATSAVVAFAILALLTISDWS